MQACNFLQVKKTCLGIFILWVHCFHPFLHAEQPKSEDKEGDVPVIHRADINPISKVIGRAVVDLGTLQSNQTVAARLVLTNKMPIVLELNQAIAGCGCLNVTAVNEVVLPDEVFAVQVDFKPKSDPRNFRTEQTITLGRKDPSGGSTLSQNLNQGLIKIVLKYQLDQVLHFENASVSKEFSGDEQLPVSLHLPIRVSADIDPELVFVKSEAAISTDAQIVRYPAQGTKYKVKLDINELPPRGQRRLIDVRVYDPDRNLKSSLAVSVLHRTDVQLFPSSLVFRETDQDVWEANATLKQGRSEQKGTLASSKVKAMLDDVELHVSVDWLSDRIGKATVRLDASILKTKDEKIPTQGEINWLVSTPLLGDTTFRSRFIRREQRQLPLPPSLE